jgi:hypothetical protein
MHHNNQRIGVLTGALPFCEMDGFLGQNSLPVLGLGVAIRSGKSLAAEIVICSRRYQSNVTRVVMKAPSWKPSQRYGGVIGLS